jgi:hypothetical protein
MSINFNLFYVYAFKLKRKFSIGFMLVYKKTYNIKHIEEGSLLYPTIFTIHLENKESFIILKLHGNTVFIDKKFTIDVRITNHYEVLKNYHVSLNGIFHKIVEKDHPKTYVFEMVHNGHTSIISLPNKYLALFNPKDKVSLSIKVIP